MSGYPTVEGERRVPHEELRAAVAAIFECCGMSEEDAGLLIERRYRAEGIPLTDETLNDVVRTAMSLGVRADRRLGG